MTQLVRRTHHRLIGFAAALVLGASADGQAPSFDTCPHLQPAAFAGAEGKPLAGVAVPGRPFGVTVAPDNQTIFVGMSPKEPGAGSGVAVLRQTGAGTRMSHLIPLGPNPAGLQLSHDGRWLLVATGDGVAVLDAKRASAGSSGAVAGKVTIGAGSGVIEVAISKDDRYAFSANERRQSVSVIDMEAARGNAKNARIGDIPVDLLPVGMAISADGRYLYVTSERVDNATAGSLTVVDIAKAVRQPAKSIIARVPAGCGPVRVAVSPQDEVVWVTARGSNALLAFDAARLISTPATALLATAPVGPAPVGIELMKGGALVAVADSNRFEGRDAPQTITILDAAAVLAQKPSVRSVYRVGIFPREFGLSPDGRTLFLTNFLSGVVSIFDVSKLGQ